MEFVKYKTPILAQKKGLVYFLLLSKSTDIGGFCHHSDRVHATTSRAHNFLREIPVIPRELVVTSKEIVALPKGFVALLKEIALLPEEIPAILKGLVALPKEIAAIPGKLVATLRERFALLGENVSSLREIEAIASRSNRSRRLVGNDLGLRVDNRATLLC